MPRGLLRSVVSINTYDENNVATVWDISNTIIDDQNKSIYLRLGAAWPHPSRSTLGVEVTYKAGFGASPDDVPAPIRQSIMAMVAYYYELRSTGHNNPISLIPNSALTMLSAFKTRRL